jgi:hypothetical protein
LEFLVIDKISNIFYTIVDMDIYVSPQVGAGRIRSAIINQIKQAGHTVTEHVGFASYAIGYQDTGFKTLDPEQQIIIKEEIRGDNVVHRKGQHLLHPGTLVIMGTGKVLSHWLETAPDLLAAKL